MTGPQETAGLGITGIVLRPSVFGERLTGAFPDGGDGPSVMQDVNGDGLNDFVIGDARANSAHVVFGRTATSPVDATNLGGDGYSIVGSTGLTGHSAAIVEDITHDGLADTVIGAPGSINVLIPGLGAAYIVPGSSERNGSVSVADAGQGIVKLTTGVAGDRFGAGVAGLGDTDLDGRADFAVATKSGALVVRTAPTTDKIVTAADGFAITSVSANTGGLLGTSVPEAPIAAAGDLDGDYRNDLVIGYPDAGDRRAYTILSPDGSTSMNATSTLAGQLGSSVANGTTGDRSGAAVSAAGYTGNPVSENAQAIIGAPMTNSSLLGGSAGAAYIMSERTPTGPETTLDEEDSTTSATPNAAANRADLNYPIGLYQLNDGWATVRNKYAQFVMGTRPAGRCSTPTATSTSGFTARCYTPPCAGVAGSIGRTSH